MPVKVQNNITIIYGKFHVAALLSETKYLQTNITIQYLSSYLQTTLTYKRPKRQKQQHHVTSNPYAFLFVEREDVIF